MKDLPPINKQALDQERDEILQQLEDWLDLPMLVLSFGWLALFIIELIFGLTPLLDLLGVTIWIIFILDFGVKFFLASHKVRYLKQNWLITLSLIIPALRTLRIVRVLRALQSARAVRGLQLLRVMTRTNRGMRALAASINRRGFAYVVALTAIVTLIGAAGMYAFERDLANSGLPDYGTALWWTAMIITTMGSDYFPRTPEGRVLCFFLALYAFAVFGYVTATLATFFVDRDAEDPEAEVAGARAIADLQAEIAALRAEIQTLVHQDSNPEA
ncbi:potassium channel family protein [Oculatella sp. LEGE 06141]|uniref:potassium channel family protein n=1 Tax=Oculatella sp. LEGE 06141 TaxID=1828648 RepID=UPI001881B6A1|nr:potassium channel family protein [Oculatella sp. LEGE 06141]MBE9182489.1 potassium channel family protein [Oculatella sp. LEGE 06141]